MVTTDKKRVVITMKSDDPKKTLKELRNAITTVTTVLVGPDEWNYHAALPEAVSSLIRLQAELVRSED